MVISFERDVGSKSAVRLDCELCDHFENKTVGKKELSKLRRARRCFDEEMMIFG
jgi:hypothetical protein